ncbi:MAG: hypothetical protein QXG03_01935 [Halalkalicoccus sp.]
MSLRCSLLGHEYGEREIERDREERGNEVVISVVELERCTHCGATRTISENTEVTQLSRSDAAGSSTEPAASEGQESPGIRPRPAATADSKTTSEAPRTDDAPSDTAPKTTRESGPASEPEPAEPTETGVDIGHDPDAEDAEIIDDGPDGVETATDSDPEREPVAWPDADDQEERTDEPAASWPVVEGEDEGFDAATPDGPTDVEFGGGLTPQADQGAEIVGDDGDGNGTVVSASSTPATDRRGRSRGETALYCPSCETSGLEERDSLRAGDICPECHRGYLAERER